jgi:hypothetical protein
VQWENQIKNGSCRDLNLFKLENGYNLAFYIDQSGYFYVKSFSDSGSVLKQATQILNIRVISCRITKLGDEFIINVPSDINYSSVTFCGIKTINFNYTDQDGFIPYAYSGRPNANIGSLIFKIDESINYITHKCVPYPQTLHMAANNSNLICIDRDDNYYYYHSNLDLVPNKSVNTMKESVGKSLVDIEMNDENAFILCQTQKLKIFDLASFSLLSELNVFGNQIKLIPNNYLALFDSTNYNISFYNQTNFAKGDEFSLHGKITAGLTMAHDKSEFISFYKKQANAVEENSIITEQIGGLVNRPPFAKLRDGRIKA